MQGDRGAEPSLHWPRPRRFIKGSFATRQPGCDRSSQVQSLSKMDMKLFWQSFPFLVIIPIVLLWAGVGKEKRNEFKLQLARGNHHNPWGIAASALLLISLVVQLRFGGGVGELFQLGALTFFFVALCIGYRRGRAR